MEKKKEEMKRSNAEEEKWRKAKGTRREKGEEEGRKDVKG
jgi:hypothetical protein